MKIRNKNQLKLPHDPIRNGVFKFFLQINKRSNALCIDKTSGAMLSNLIPHIGWAVCFCANFSDAKDMRAYLLQNKLKNFDLVVGDISALPFIDSVFDITCLHRCNSFIGLDIKQKVLKNEIIRSLKAEGQCYLSFSWPASSNKFYRIGDNWLRKISSKEFTNTACIYNYGSFDNPGFIRIIRRRVRYELSNMAFGLKRRIAGNDMAVLFQKGYKNIGSDESLSSIIKKDIEKSSNKKLINPSTVMVGSGASHVCDYGKTIVRFPQNDIGLLRCKNNYSTLKVLEKYDLNIQTPSATHKGEVSGQKYFAESKIEGVALDGLKLGKMNSQRIHSQAYRFLTNNNMIVDRMTDNIFKTVVSFEFEKLEPYLLSSDIALLNKIKRLMHEDFINKQLKLVIQHGDFKLSNFIATKGFQKNLVGIIDWDLSRIPGLPVIDIIMMIIYSKLSFGELFIDKIWDMNSKDNMWVQAYLEWIGADKKTYKLLLIYMIIFYLNNFFWDKSKIEKNKWYCEMISGYLVPICKQVTESYD